MRSLELWKWRQWTTLDLEIAVNMLSQGNSDRFSPCRMRSFIQSWFAWASSTRKVFLNSYDLSLVEWKVWFTYVFYLPIILEGEGPSKVLNDSIMLNIYFDLTHFKRDYQTSTVMS